MLRPPARLGHADQVDETHDALDLLAVDRPLDMMRTVVNVWSDSCGAAVIARSEGEPLTLLEAMRAAGVRDMVFSSSFRLP